MKNIVLTFLLSLALSHIAHSQVEWRKDTADMIGDKIDIDSILATPAKTDFAIGKHLDGSGWIEIFAEHSFKLGPDSMRLMICGFIPQIDSTCNASKILITRIDMGAAIHGALPKDANYKIFYAQMLTFRGKGRYRGLINYTDIIERPATYQKVQKYMFDNLADPNVLWRRL